MPEPDEIRTIMAEEFEGIRRTLDRVGALVEDLVVSLEEAREREQAWQQTAARQLKEQADRRRGV